MDIIPSDMNISPTRSDDSGYDSSQSHNDNPVIRDLVFELKNDYEEKDGIHGNGELRKYVNARINRRLGM